MYCVQVSNDSAAGEHSARRHDSALAAKESTVVLSHELHAEQSPPPPKPAEPEPVTSQVVADKTMPEIQPSTGADESDAGQATIPHGEISEKEAGADTDMAEAAEPVATHAVANGEEMHVGVAEPESLKDSDTAAPAEEDKLETDAAAPAEQAHDEPADTAVHGGDGETRQAAESLGGEGVAHGESKVTEEASTTSDVLADAADGLELSDESPGRPEGAEVEPTITELEARATDAPMAEAGM